MAAILRVVLDAALSPGATGTGHYTEELTRALIRTAPRGCTVHGIVSAQSPERVERLAARLPGIAEIHRSTLARRELTTAWQLGIASGIGEGMLHSPSLLAPLRRHSRESSQIVVTLRNTLAWTDPKSLTPTSVAWQKQMLKRARRHADAIVVPTHAVATQLAEIADFGDRIRVIPEAPASTLLLPADAAWRASNLDLPERYLLTLGSLDPRRGLDALLHALAQPGVPDLPLLVIGPDQWGSSSLTAAADEAGLEEGRVRALGDLGGPDLATVYERAELFIYPSVRESTGMPILEAFSHGTPVLHTDDPALLEVSGGAGEVVEARGAGFPERLAAAITELVEDAERRSKLGIAGADRAQVFDWRDSAERVWALHAEL
ncbi:glycosyltransferase family 1 protein [Mycetocola tolaasinivorans]|uniref:Glycosyltransferase family 1 protein n=1 Tax=Mycetocola tolaasinivorans TaxID=76635 RepID=A0A3L7A8R7_9MICO|nr:glycosyltransferase family 1 protein [Mycetocola tolaasinivorans]RLP75981.1 glycosyltransferase family 1 protein [Mycetocola tolaasinivorans]